VKRILLIGAAHAHLVVLRSLARTPLYGARVALVAPRPKQIYSGMLPGLIAGHYRLDEVQVDLGGLAARAQAEFIEGEVAELDPGRKLARLADGAELEFDVASLGVGSLVDASLPGSREHAMAAKPFHEFVDRLDRRKPSRIAIAGAGAAGMELAMALRYRGAQVTLYSERPAMSDGLAARAVGALRRLGVDFRPGMPLTAVESGPVAVAGPSHQEFEAVLLATGARAPRWLRDSGLEADRGGFVRVDATLRSVSHPELFAAGDCASLVDAPHAKSGVYSVRHGKVLDENLRNWVARRPLERFVPQRKALALLSCGGRYAIAERGTWTAEGRWVWRWKDWIDRRWLRSLSSAA
jgi:pyridine nucleotide-disulfide oxidoreductase family protein